VNPHSVFVRKECILPERFDPLREPVGESWTLVEEITAPVFDTMIRQMDWHFMWVDHACSRIGIATNEETAVQRALARALAGVARRFNAAELVSVQMNRSLGLHIAFVTVQPRVIQQHSWLDMADAAHPQTVAAR
jgi:hypothetical protein